jgi:hypothetical protein
VKDLSACKLYYSPPSENAPFLSKKCLFHFAAARFDGLTLRDYRMRLSRGMRRRESIDQFGMLAHQASGRSKGVRIRR